MGKPTARGRALIAALALCVSACGGADAGQVTSDTVDVGGLIPIEGDVPASVEASPRFLRQVADATEAAPSLRFEIDTAFRSSMGGMAISIDPTEPYATGEVAGGSSRVVLDMGVLLRAMTEQLAGGAEVFDALGVDDLTIEVRSGAGGTFIRAPMLGALAAMAPSSSVPWGPLTELGEGWGYIDPARLGDVVPTDVLDGLTGGQSADPMRLTALLRAVEGEVTAVGRTELRGVPVTHLSGTVTVGQLLEAQGTTAADLRELSDPDTDLSAVMDAVLATPVPIDVFVDDEEQLRRVAYSLDLGPVLARAASEAGQAVAVGELVFDIAMDVYDHGATDIVVELPDRSDAVDVTDWMLQVAAG